MGKELGVISENVLEYLRKLDKEREKSRISKPRKKRKIKIDTSYAPGAY